MKLKLAVCLILMLFMSNTTWVEADLFADLFWIVANQIQLGLTPVCFDEWFRFVFEHTQDGLKVTCVVDWLCFCSVRYNMD